MLRVFKESCKNCLLTPDRIVSPAVAKGIIQDCKRQQTHFICHKAIQEGKEVLCKTFYDRLGFYSQMVRIAQRLNMVEFIPQTDTEKLITHIEMNKSRKRKS